MYLNYLPKGNFILLGYDNATMGNSKVTMCLSFKVIEE
jgi:hypothetical protein